MSPTSNSTCTASEHVSNNFTNLCNHISLLQISQPQTASLRERESVRKTRMVLASIEQATMKEWDTNRSSTCESYESSSNRIKYCKSTTNINNTTNACFYCLTFGGSSILTSSLSSLYSSDCGLNVCF